MSCSTSTAVGALNGDNSLQEPAVPSEGADGPDVAITRPADPDVMMADGLVTGCSAQRDTRSQQQQHSKQQQQQQQGQQQQQQAEAGNTATPGAVQDQHLRGVEAQPDNGVGTAAAVQTRSCPSDNEVCL